MKTTRILTAAIALATLLASCGKETPNENPGGPVAVSFTAGIEEAAAGDPAALPSTRASGTEWADGDAIGIFMVGHGGATVAEGAANRQYVTAPGGSAGSSSAGDGAFAPATAADAMYYPMDGSAVDFVAYYPFAADASLDTPLPVAVATAQSADNQSTFDLLWAKADTGYSKNSSGAVALSFGHSLAKIVMNTVAGTGVAAADLAGMTVSITGMNTRASFDLSDGTLDAPGTPAAITPRTATDGSAYDAIILPGSYSADAVKVLFTLDGSGETFTWTLTAAEAAFEAGSEYIYEVTLSRTGVSVTGTITPWNTIDRLGVTAE